MQTVYTTPPFCFHFTVCPSHCEGACLEGIALSQRETSGHCTRMQVSQLRAAGIADPWLHWIFEDNKNNYSEGQATTLVRTGDQKAGFSYCQEEGVPCRIECSTHTCIQTRSGGSSVVIATRLPTGRPRSRGLIPGRSKRFFSSS
jgi:hypothetical protein